MLFLCGSVSQLEKFSYSQKVEWTFCVIIVPRSEHSNFVPIRIANWKSRDTSIPDKTYRKIVWRSDILFICSYQISPCFVSQSLTVSKCPRFPTLFFSGTIAFRQNLRNSRTNRLRHAEYSPRLDRKGILRRFSGQKGISHEGVSGVRL